MRTTAPGPSSIAIPSAASPPTYTIGRRLGPVCFLVVLFAVTRLSTAPAGSAVASIELGRDSPRRAARALAGDNLDVSTLSDGMPLLDVELLRHDLPRSLWHLHSQPPLFNLLVAGMLRLGRFALAWQYLNWSLGLLLSLTCYALMRGLGAGALPAVAATSLLIVNPNGLWMETAVYYGVLMAALLAVAAFAFHRAVARGSLAWFALLCAVLAVVPLTRAFFPWPWCVLAAGFSAAAFLRCAPSVQGSRRRSVLLLAALPVVLVAAFQVKQIALFGQWTGSSWLGCNLTTMTAGMRSIKERALERGQVSPLVKVYRNDSVETYRRYFPVAPAGIPALDQARKSTGQVNFNNSVYIPVGRQYLSDSLFLIVRHPLIYLGNVVNSLYIFSGYQTGLGFDAPAAFFSRWTWREIAAPFLGFPMIAAAVWFGLTRARGASGRPDAWRWTVAFLTANVLAVAAVACLVEKNEGPLYRYQVDAFLWTLLALLASEWLARRKARKAGTDVRVRD